MDRMVPETLKTRRLFRLEHLKISKNWLDKMNVGRLKQMQNIQSLELFFITFTQTEILESIQVLSQLK